MAIPPHAYNDYPARDVAETVDAAVSELRPLSGWFDSIAVRGVSGIMIGAPVAYMLGKPLIVVRKPGDSAHAGSLTANHDKAGDRYIILDDFTSTGATVSAISAAMERDAPGARLAGLYMYASPDKWRPVHAARDED